jgi:hypothetical protein
MTAVVIKDVIQDLRAIAQDHLEIYEEKVDEGTLNGQSAEMSSAFQEIFKDQPELKNLQASIDLLEFLGNIVFLDDEATPDIALTLDTTLSQSMLELQVLKDLLLFAQNPIDKFLQDNLIILLKRYSPYLENAPENATSLKTFLEKTIASLSVKMQAELDANQRDPKHKKYEDIKESAVLTKAEASGKFSHATNTVHKVPKAGEASSAKHANIWYAKYVKNKSVALYEAMAQEFFRLIIPYQPKTRLSKNKYSDIYILSKGVPDSDSLEKLFMNDPANVKNKLSAGKYTGLGRIMMLCLFLQETDAKLGNMLIDKQNRIVKIDGDWCFSGQINPSKFKEKYSINSIDIRNLPFLEAFKPYNWLDIFCAGKFNSKAYRTNGHTALVSHDFNNNPEFRREVNETLLKLLILPHSIIEKFISHFTSNTDIADHMHTLLTSRLEAMRAEALEEKSFQQYIVSDKAKEYFKVAFEELTKFQPVGKKHLVDIKYYQSMNLHFEDLQKQSQKNILKEEEANRVTPFVAEEKTVAVPPPKKPLKAFLPPLKIPIIKPVVIDPAPRATFQNKESKAAHELKTFKVKLEPIQKLNPADTMDEVPVKNRK